MLEVIKALAGPLATVIAAAAAVWVTHKYARHNLAISREQLRQARFGQRLEVYLSASAFYNELIGNWEGNGEQLKVRERFFVAMQAAYFLFDGDPVVEATLTDLNTSSFVIMGYKEHKQEYRDNPQFSLEQFNKTQEHLLKYFPSKLEALRAVIRPYTDISALSGL